MGNWKKELERRQRIGRLERLNKVEPKIINLLDIIENNKEKGLTFQSIIHSVDKITISSSITESYHLYLDDERLLPSYMNVLVKSVGEGKKWLQNEQNLSKLETISFDWDLGVGYEQGNILLEYVRDETLAGRFPEVKLRVHTSSEKARYEIMFPLVREIMKYWKNKKDE